MDSLPLHALLLVVALVVAIAAQGAYYGAGQHMKLRDRAASESAKKHWGERLDALAALLTAASV